MSPIVPRALAAVARTAGTGSFRSTSMRAGTPSLSPSLPRPSAAFTRTFSDVSRSSFSRVSTFGFLAQAGPAAAVPARTPTNAAKTSRAPGCARGIIDGCDPLRWTLHPAPYSSIVLESTWGVQGSRRDDLDRARTARRCNELRATRDRRVGADRVGARGRFDEQRSGFDVGRERAGGDRSRREGED